MLFVVDDLADDKRTMGCNLIRELMLRGRHRMISSVLSTQKMRAIDHACRLQFTALAQFAVRSTKDWEVLKKSLQQPSTRRFCKRCTTSRRLTPYGFLFMDMKNNKFYRSFKSELEAS